MTFQGAAPTFSRTPHLVALIAHAERLLGRVSGLDGARLDAVRAPLLEAACLASLRLDGAPLEGVPDLDAAAHLRDEVVADTGRAGGWFAAMGRLDDRDERVSALEYLGVEAATTADDLAPALTLDPVDTLATLHGRLTGGLVARDRQGRLRDVEQAVHDASTGRVIYFAADPSRIATELHLLAAWLASAGAREHAIVTSGVLHLELLRIHPYDAANGRLARAAARLVLRARGLDPAALVAPEVDLATDPVAYYDEVRRTVRRRDLTIWLERWGEAVVAGARHAARALGVLDPDPPARAVDFAGRRAQPRFTVADYRAEVGVGPEESRADLEALLDAGIVALTPGSRGLRFEVAG